MRIAFLVLTVAIKVQVLISLLLGIHVCIRLDLDIKLDVAELVSLDDGRHFISLFLLPLRILELLSEQDLSHLLHWHC